MNLILKKLKQGGRLSNRAQKEFQKMIRNARFEGAHNRFSGREQSNIAKLVQQISEAASRLDKGMPLVPEFIVSRSIEGRLVSEEARVIDDSLMKVEEFKNSWTNNGVLYHGTPRFEYVLSMIRNGLMPSIPKSQGTAFYSIVHSD